MTRKSFHVHNFLSALEKTSKVSGRGTSETPSQSYEIWQTGSLILFNTFLEPWMGQRLFLEGIATNKFFLITFDLFRFKMPFVGVSWESPRQRRQHLFITVSQNWQEGVYGGLVSVSSRRTKLAISNYSFTINIIWSNCHGNSVQLHCSPHPHILACNDIY